MHLQRTHARKSTLHYQHDPRMIAPRMIAPRNVQNLARRIFVLKHLVHNKRKEFQRISQSSPVLHAAKTRTKVCRDSSTSQRTLVRETDTSDGTKKNKSSAGNMERKARFPKGTKVYLRLLLRLQLEYCVSNHNRNTISKFEAATQPE